jgi:hypothetical protein
MLRRERQNMLSLMSLGMNSQQAVELIASPVISESKSVQDLTKGIFDIRDKSEKKNIIIWFNDLEKDKRYSNWPTRIFDVCLMFCIFYFYTFTFIYTHININIYFLDTSASLSRTNEIYTQKLI